MKTNIHAMIIGIIFSIISTATFASACAVEGNTWTSNPTNVTRQFKKNISELLYSPSKLQESNGQIGPVAILKPITLTVEKTGGGNIAFLTSNRASEIIFTPTSAKSSLLDVDFDSTDGILKYYEIKGKAKIKGNISNMFASKEYPAQLILVGKGNYCQVVLSKWMFSVNIPKKDINAKEIVNQQGSSNADTLKDTQEDGIMLKSSGRFTGSAVLELPF